MDATTIVTLLDPLQKTAALAENYLDRACQAADLVAAMPGPVFWNPETDKVAAVLPVAERLSAPWILLKQSQYHPLQQPLKLFTDLQSYVGGPSPLAAMLVGSGIGGALVYGAGWLASRLLPKKHFNRNRLATTLGLAGAGLGAIPGLCTGLLTDRQVPGVPELTYRDLGWNWTSYGPGGEKSSAVNPVFVKAAEDNDNGTGLFFGQTVPVDAFNRTVWQNTMPNPYGTKDAFGTNEQSLHTPPPVAAVATGLVHMASTMNGGSPTVSPFEIGLAAARSGIGGLAGGWLLGKTIGALAGLSPAGQSVLQRTGLFGGILTGAVRKLMGG